MSAIEADAAYIAEKKLRIGPVILQILALELAAVATAHP